MNAHCATDAEAESAIASANVPVAAEQAHSPLTPRDSLDVCPVCKGKPFEPVHFIYEGRKSIIRTACCDSKGTRAAWAAKKLSQ